MIRVRLKQLLFDKGVTQLELHERTGIRLATINGMANNKHKTISLNHLFSIMQALNIYDVREYIEVIGGVQYANDEIRL